MAATWTFPGSETEHPAVEVYAGGFEVDSDSWTSVEVDTVNQLGTTTPHTGSGVLETSTALVTGGPVSATRTVTDLTVGREYTAVAWLN